MRAAQRRDRGSGFRARTPANGPRNDRAGHLRRGAGRCRAIRGKDTRVSPLRAVDQVLCPCTEELRLRAPRTDRGLLSEKDRDLQVEAKYGGRPPDGCR